MKTIPSVAGFVRVSLCPLALSAVPAALVACSGDAGEPDDASSTLSSLAKTTRDPATTTSTTRGDAGSAPPSSKCLRLVAQAPAASVSSRTAGRSSTGVVSGMLVARPPATVPAGSPSWVKTCSLTKYIVRTNSDACRPVFATHGTWAGEAAFPGESTGICRYTWGGAKVPAAVDYESLDAAAPRTQSQSYSINADCPPPSAPPPECGSPSTAPAQLSEDPMPRRGDGGIIPQGLTSCDTCASAGQDKLFVTIDPAWASRPTMWAVDSDQHYVQFTPVDTQLFKVPVPPGTFSAGEPIALLFSRF